MKITTLGQWEHVREAIGQIERAQANLAGAGLSTTPTFYKLTNASQTLVRRLKSTKKPHQPGCLCPHCDTFKPIFKT